MQSKIINQVQGSFVLKPIIVVLGIVILSILIIPMVATPSAATNHDNHMKHGPVPFPPELIPPIDIHSHGLQKIVNDKQSHS